jgi:hypothetical protein
MGKKHKYNVNLYLNNNKCSQASYFHMFETCIGGAICYLYVSSDPPRIVIAPPKQRRTRRRLVSETPATKGLLEYNIYASMYVYMHC